ncbi:MAG: hypothetical protein ACP5IB_08580 [Thermoplasmata archaeon]|jgi:DNA helicase HerA-like ATPase
MVEYNKPIGKTTSTQQIPSTVDKFYFWIAEGIEVQPYDFVTAKEENFVSVGIIKGISNYTDAQNHLSNRLISDIKENILQRFSITIAEVEVIYSYIIKNKKEHIEKIYPISSGIPVYISTKEEILESLTAISESKETVPGGIISRTSGESVIVPLNINYLLGPESGHLNVSGISGLATKTSYMMFLLYNINKTYPKNYINIIFNVKGYDLLNIDKPAKDLSDDDKEMYKIIFGTSNPSPFLKVEYYFPRGLNGNPNTYSTRKDYKIYAFTFKDIYCDLDLLFSDVIDEYHTVESFARYIKKDWNSKNERWELQSHLKNRELNIFASNWTEFKDHLDKRSKDISEAYGLYPSTMGRIKRNLDRLTSFPTFVDKRARNEVFIRDIIRNATPGETIVIDIAKLNKSEQTFVVGEVFRELEDIIRTENEKTKKKAIIVVDELNSIAPKSENTPLKEQVIEVVRKGRDAGFIIFGAEQFASEVDDQIVGNSALRVIGRTSSMEISSAAYKNLSPEDKSTVMMLRKGEMLMSFPIFRSNLKIRFPKPPYLRPESSKK